MTDALSRRQDRVLSKVDRRPSMLAGRDVAVLGNMLDPAESESVQHAALDAVDTLVTAEDVPADELLKPLEHLAAIAVDATEAVQSRHRRALELHGRLACQHATPGDGIQSFYRDVLAEPQPTDIRRAAVVALGTVTTTRLTADPDSIETLVEQLETDEPAVAAPAAIALGGALQRLLRRSGDDYRATIERLVDGLFDSDPWVRVGCLRALAMIAEADVSRVTPYTAVVQDALTDDCSVVRHEAVATVEIIAVEDSDVRTDVLGWLRDRVEDDETVVGQAAIGAIETVWQKTTDNSAVSPEFLATTAVSSGEERWPTAAVDRDEPTIRNRAAELLAEIGRESQALGSDAVGTLVTALEADDFVVRECAVEALGTIGATTPSLVADAVSDITATALEDEDPEVHANAVDALEEIAAANPALVKDAVGDLTTALGADDSDTRRGATDALEKIGAANPALVEDAVNYLITTLDTDDPRIRADAAEALGKIGATNPAFLNGAVDDLTTALGADDSGLRRNAAEALGNIGASNPALVEDAVGDLAGVLEDDHPGIRTDATEALEKICVANPALVKDAVDYLTAALASDDSGIRADAAEALGKIGATNPALLDGAVDDLTVALGADDSGLQRNAAEALGNIGAANPSHLDGAVDDLITALEDGGLFVSESAAEALEKISAADPDVFRGAVSDLVAAALDGNCRRGVDRRVRAIGVLGAIGVQNPSLLDIAVDDLVTALEDGGRFLRESAVEALGNIGVANLALLDDSVGCFMTALEDDGPRVRAQAAEALGNIGAATPSLVGDAVADLVAALEDNHHAVRAQAAEALGNIGAADPTLVESAVDDLTTVAHEDDSTVRSSAAEALARVAVTASVPLPVDELRSIAARDPRVAVGLLTSGSAGVVQARTALAADDGVESAPLSPLGGVAMVTPQWVRPLETDLHWLRYRTDDKEVRNTITAILDALSEDQSERTGVNDNGKSEQPTAPSSQPIPEEIPTADPLAVDDPTFDVIETHSGGFDTVSVATVEEADRVVAVKHPDRTRLEDISKGELHTLPPGVVERFRDERDNWGKVDDSDYIVSVLDSEMNPCPHIVLEYADGGTLRQRMATEDIGVAEALWIGECLATAKRHAEKRGVMHHDIKPENVLFRTTDGDEWPVPKVSDWGLSRQLAGRPPSEVDGLTPPYVAPEQRESGATVDHEADVFQLGVVLYELLTGRQPGDGTDTPVEWNRVSLSGVGGAVPDDVGALLDEMTAVDPAVRVTVNEVADRLRSCRLSLDTA